MFTDQKSLLIFLSLMMYLFARSVIHIQWMVSYLFCEKRHSLQVLPNKHGSHLVRHKVLVEVLKSECTCCCVTQNKRYLGPPYCLPYCVSYIKLDNIFSSSFFFFFAGCHPSKSRCLKKPPMPCLDEVCDKLSRDLLNQGKLNISLLKLLISLLRAI